MVCCKGFSRRDENLPFRAFDFILGAYREQIEEKDFTLYERERFVSQEAPSYVGKILEGVELSEEDWHGIKVNRVTVIYERQ